MAPRSLVAAFQAPLLPLAAHAFISEPQHPTHLFPRTPALSKRRWDSCRGAMALQMENSKKQDDQTDPEEDLSKAVEAREKEFLQVAHVESLEEILEELEAFGGTVDDQDDDDFFLDEFDEETLEELFLSLPDDGDEDDDEETYLDIRIKQQSASLLENALLQGVVPASAGVGSNCMTGDFGFDPLDLASKDYFPRAQAFVRDFIPPGEDEEVPEARPGEETTSGRPKALILRDYREAELRHGRLAMLAAVFWPLQELLDRWVLEEEKFDSLLHSLFNGGVTLPYFPLLMTAIMLLLGYLDIYSQTIKDVEGVGEAYLPGDCFWDPLNILAGAPDAMKRNMQERELFNGRFAMLAIAVFIWEEARTGKPIVSIDGNEVFFEPAYQIPFIQKWLDSQFSSPSPVFYNLPEDALEAITSLDMDLSSIQDAFRLTI